MAQSEDVAAGQKRGSNRPSRNEQRFEKRRKISTNLSTPLSSLAQSPIASSPAPEKQYTKLRSKVSENRPLPTLSDPQASALADNDYQSIKASAVLQTSLDRSRIRWVGEGILEKYWIKPESGKNARPAPPNNPELKWQKHKGPCRIRIEPHIFEAEVYVEEKAKPAPAPVRPYVPPGHQQSAYGQPYRQNSPHQPYGQHQQYYHNRMLPPMQQQAQGHPPSSNLPPIGNVSQSPGPQPGPPPRTQPSPSQSQQEKKASPDPVISMLATRASSDPELKALMKEVATGNATQDQLKVFQNHIDELTKVINEKKKKEEEDAATSAEAAAKASVQQSEMIQYDGAGDGVIAPQFQQPQQRPYPPVHRPPQQQHTWTPPAPPQQAPAPTSLPVILAYTTPGSTEDRFLFPQNSILEALSPQHLLASFIVTRKGSEAAESNGLDPNLEYWQPVTLMVEVAYNREHILDCVRRWVKPAEEVTKNMEEVMSRCVKVPETYLALRLPFKGSAMAETEDASTEDTGTPMLSMDEKAKVKPRSSVKYIKKARKDDVGKEKTEVKGESESGGKKGGEIVDVAAAPQVSPPDTSTEQNKSNDTIVTTTTTKGDGAEGFGDVQTTTETGRPKRAVRKSVRISEG